MVQINYDLSFYHFCRGVEHVVIGGSISTVEKIEEKTVL